jgi:hypothetical protein
LATKFGTGSSTPTAGTILRGTGSGTSSWGKLTLSTDVNTFSSSDLRTLLTDETGSGVAVFGTGPTLSDITVNGNIDIQDSSTAIRDSSDNELVKFTKTTSAVNEITITNAATTGNPLIAPSGGDTNIHLRLQGKGTGGVWADLYNPYKFSVHLAANQTGIADSTFTKVLFDTELFDTNNNFASNRYTVPVTGFYQINAYAAIQSANNTGLAGILSLYKNGVEYLRADTGYPTVGTGASPILAGHISHLLSLTAGDYLEIFVYMDVTSSTITVTGGIGGARFSGYLASLS